MITSTVVALLALAAAPDAAAEAGCIIAQFSAAERSQVAEMARRNSEPPAELQRRLEDVGAGCAETRGWTAATAPGFIGLAVATIIQDEVAPRLRELGIDPAAVDAWLSRQSEQVRVTPAFQPADAERLVLDLNAGGVPMPTLEAHGELIGVYVGARIMVERAGRGLPL